MSSDDDAVLALDIGGTKVAAAVVAPDGELLADGEVPTGRGSEPEELYAPVEAMLSELLGRGADPLGERVRVGIGSAGPIHAPEGQISPVNIAAWRRWPVRDRVLTTVVRATGRPAAACLVGDGHGIAMGEHWLGAGRELDSMIGLVISTGIGAGVVLDDVLLAGRTGNAVHLGHTSVDFSGPRCVCGGHGCVESYARGPAMVAAAQAAGWQGSDAVDLTRDAAAGHPVASAAIEHGMRALAAGVAQLATDLDVTTVVVGGGVARAGEVVLEPLRRHLGDFAVLHYVRHLEVVPAELDNAGLLGAAAAALALSGHGPLRAAPVSATLSPAELAD